jgi:nucleoside-triphosphatase THEP1
MAIVLLTGAPHIGKTTIIKDVISSLDPSAVGGFYTREMQSCTGERVGFEIMTLDGESDCLATKQADLNFSNQILFGDYRVNLDAIDLTGVPALLVALKKRKTICIDEIGPMEIFSEIFQHTILRIINSDANIIGTIVERPYQFADTVKAHPGVTIVPVTLENRNSLPGYIVSFIKDAG